MTGLAAILAPLLARLRPAAGDAANPLGLEQVIALDPRRRLNVVRWGDRRVLLLTGGPADLVVGWSEGAAERAS